MENSPQDSPDPQASDSVAVARAISPHGVDGGLSISLFSDVPGRFDPGRTLFADRTARAVTSYRPTGPKTGLIWLDGISTREQASSLSGQFLTAPPESDSQLEEGEYFHYQLIGMRVVTEDGEYLGEIGEILETGSNDVYIVRGDAGELLIPGTTQVVLQVDLDGNEMRVRLLDGLR